MKKKYPAWLTTFFVLLLSLILCGGSAAKEYIDIDAPGFQQFPIAVCDFSLKNTLSSPSPNVDAAIPDGIRNLLGLSGLFRILDKKSFLDGVEAGSPETIRFSDWSVIGADFLLRGDITTGAGGLMVESRLYDVTRGQLLLNKKYSDPSGNPAAIARLIATDVVQTLTGNEGDFMTKVAFVIKKSGAADIYTTDYDAADLTRLTRHQSIIMSPRWSPDGQYLAFTSYKSGRPEVYLHDLRTGREKKVASYAGLNLCGSFSPDSRKLLLTLSKDDNEEIYVLDIDNLALKRLTRNFAIDVSPAWSPDGKKIAFVSNRSGSPQIFVMDPDGNNVKRITFEGNYNTSPSWSPRGGRIAYEGRINGRYQIFSTDEEGSNLLQLTFDNADNEYPSWSPSGRQIVFSSRDGSRSRISIMNSNGMNIRVLKEGKEHLIMPAWSPRFK